MSDIDRGYMLDLDRGYVVDLEWGYMLDLGRNDMLDRGYMLHINWGYMKDLDRRYMLDLGGIEGGGGLFVRFRAMLYVRSRSGCMLDHERGCL